MKTAAKETKAKAGSADTAEKPHRRTLRGVVVSNKMQKTIVVKVERQVRHAVYSKYIKKSAKYKAHDETNDAKIGDLVQIVECRPMSAEKRFALQTIIRRANQTGDIATV